VNFFNKIKADKSSDVYQEYVSLVTLKCGLFVSVR